MHILALEDGFARRKRGRTALLAGCGSTVVVLMLATFGYLAWANVLPAPEPDERVFPQANGYEAVAAAVANLARVPSARNPWSADLKVLREDLTRTRPQLTAVSAAIRLPYLAPLRNPDSVGPYTHYFEASRQLVAQARLDLVEGSPSIAVQRCLDVIELGVKMGRGGLWIDSLDGVGCVTTGQFGLERCISRLTAGEAGAAGDRLERIVSQLPEPAGVIDEERRFQLSWARSLLAGQLTSRPTYTGNLGERCNQAKEHALFLAYPKPWGYSQVDRRWKAIASEMRKPYSRRSALAPWPSGTDPVLPLVNFNLDDVQIPFAQLRASLSLLRTELSLQEYRLRHGVYPDALRRLVPTELAAVPADPFTDQPLRYFRRGNTYVLYSVGPDLKDSGGVPLDARMVVAGKVGDLVAGKLIPPRRPARHSR
jgi:hypothetical protein